MFTQSTKRLALILAVLVAVLLLSFAVRKTFHMKNSDRKMVSAKTVDDDLAAERNGEMSRQEHKRRCLCGKARGEPFQVQIWNGYSKF